MSASTNSDHVDEGEIGDRAECELNYPGLNKRHGFFRAIERNQVDRDVYHRNRTEWRDQRKQQTDREIAEERRRLQEAKDERRKQRRERQRPDRAVYQPPGARHSISQPNKSHPLPHQPRSTEPLYKLEIEVKPGVVWRTQVTKVGEASTLAQSAARKYSLDHSTELTIENFIDQFERDLKL